MMKRLIFVFAAMALSFASFAQTDTTMKKMDHDKMMNHDQMDMSKTDGCMMMNKKMMMIKDGKMSTMKKPMTMGNGTKTLVDGTCIKKDGTKMTMKEGDHMDMSGKHSSKGAVKAKR
jgi:hypothetical protein